MLHVHNTKPFILCRMTKDFYRSGHIFEYQLLQNYKGNRIRRAILNLDVITRVTVYFLEVLNCS